MTDNGFLGFQHGEGILKYNDNQTYDGEMG